MGRGLKIRSPPAIASPTAAPSRLSPSSPPSPVPWWCGRDYAIDCIFGAFTLFVAFILLAAPVVMRGFPSS